MEPVEERTIPGLTAPRLNHRTMGPLLRLMLAQADLEPPDLHPRDAWAVFRSFAEIPCTGFDDEVSFQATRDTETGNRPVLPFLYCTLSRELRGELPDECRAVQIQWAVEADRGVGETEIRRSGFDDLDAFAVAVESSPQFRTLSELGGVADIYVIHLQDW